MFDRISSLNEIFEGAFASRILGRNLEVLGPYASTLVGPGAWRAAPGGLLQGRFGWGNAATGYAYNAPQAPSDVLGIVIPLRSINAANGGVIGGTNALGGPQARWTWQTFDPIARAWRMRQGIVATLMNAGNFWLRFPGGASYGDTVYANLTDGTAISGAANSPISGATATPWKVVGDAAPFALTVVSSTAFFN